MVAATRLLHLDCSGCEICWVIRAGSCRLLLTVYRERSDLTGLAGTTVHAM